VDVAAEMILRAIYLKKNELLLAGIYYKAVVLIGNMSWWIQDKMMDIKYIDQLKVISKAE